MADALRARGVERPAAILAAHTGMAAFMHATRGQFRQISHLLRPRDQQGGKTVSRTVRAGDLAYAQPFESLPFRPWRGHPLPSAAPASSRSIDREGAAPAIHDQLGGWWRLAEFVPKRRYDWVANRTGWRINRLRRRTIPDDAMVHRTAFERGADYRTRLPGSITVVD